MTTRERPAAQASVERALRELGLRFHLVEFGASTLTAAEAARAAGCEPGQIVKTLLFLAAGRPTITLVAGDRQVDSAALAQVVGVRRKQLVMASPADVLRYTGFAVGSVAPVGLATPADTVVDESLRRFERVWASAGTSSSLFEVAIEDLVRGVRGQWAAITRPRA